MMRKLSAATLAMLGLLGSVGACKHEESASVGYPQQQTWQQQQQPPQPGQPVPAVPQGAPAPGGMPAPNPAAPAMPPAFGFFCATDQDPQCPFGHCLGGRCGGCSTTNDCKPGTQCLPSFFGQVCVPATAQPAPMPGPVATPQPATVPAPAPQPAPVLAPQPSPTPVAVPASQPAGSSPLERARQLCVQRTNEYRARVGVGPLVRRPDTEGCEDAQAASDGAARVAHGAFMQCREHAQNECPGWDGAPDVVIDRCLAMMFAEGPGSGPSHGHYVNMTDTRYRGVSCGFAQTPNGQLWVVQDFYP